jgi:GT2 family glycosyltransferase
VTRVDALVVTWDSAADIEECLRAVLAQRGVTPDVVVVDSGSTDGTPDLIASSFPDVNLMRLPDNVGYTVASNLGAAAGSADYLLLLNPDCHMTPDCVRALLDHLLASPECGAAAAALQYPDGRPQCFARREVTLGSAWWCLTQQHRWYGPEMSEGVDGVVTVDSPAAACVLIRRAAIDRPMFDERLPLVYSDTDLYRRLRGAGLRADVVGAATAVHGYGRSLRLVPARRMRAESVRSLLGYAEIWWSRPRRLLLWWLLLADCLGALGFAAAGKGRAQALDAVVGTAGGLGLPGGARPWLSRPRRESRRGAVAATPGSR